MNLTKTQRAIEGAISGLNPLQMLELSKYIGEDIGAVLKAGNVSENVAEVLGIINKLNPSSKDIDVISEILKGKVSFIENPNLTINDQLFVFLGLMHILSEDIKTDEISTGYIQKLVIKINNARKDKAKRAGETEQTEEIIDINVEEVISTIKQIVSSCSILNTLNEDDLKNIAHYIAKILSEVK